MNKDELKGMQDVELQESAKYLGKGLHIVKMIDYEWVVPEKGGCPYFAFTVKSEEEYLAKLKIYRERDIDAPEKKKNKREKLKRLFLAAGADFKYGEIEPFTKSALNNYFNIVLTEEEYLGYEKGNNKPTIKTVIKYNFSEPVLRDNVKVSVSVLDKYIYHPLSDQDRKKFDFELSEWDKKQPNSHATGSPVQGTPPTDEDDDQLPF